MVACLSFFIPSISHFVFLALIFVKKHLASVDASFLSLRRVVTVCLSCVRVLTLFGVVVWRVLCLMRMITLSCLAVCVSVHMCFFGGKKENV